MLSVVATREGRMLQCQHIKLMAQTPSMLLGQAWSLWYEESLTSSIATNQDGTSHDITYNPSKTLQMQFCCIAVEQCLNHADSVPNFGADARIKIEIHFCFPSSKTGQIKNTADIYNLSKFILEACNKTFYSDDGQGMPLCQQRL
jgi:hypothetical protein